MVNQQLLDYIHQQTQMGKNREEITTALHAAGWQGADVEQAFASISNPNAAPIPVSPEFPSASKILKEAWALYKSRFKTLILISLIPLLAYAIFGFIVAGGALGIGYAKINISGAGIIPIILIGAIFIIACIYIAIWGSAASLFAIKDSVEGIGWKESFKRSRPFVGRFFTTGLLGGLAVFGGLILLIIPGFIFGLWFSQSPYIVMEEGLKNTSALKRSKYYVKGRIGLIFGKLFYIGIVTAGLSILLGIAVAVISSLSGTKPEYLSWINNIFSLFWTPVITIFGYLVYKYARATRP